MDVHALQLQQIKEELTELGFLNNAGFRKTGSDSKLLEDIAFMRMFERENDQRNAADTSYSFIVTLNACIGKRTTPWPVYVILHWDHLQRKIVPESMSISTGDDRSVFFHAGLKPLPKAGEIAARMSEMYLNRRIDANVRMEAGKLAEALQQKGYIKDPTVWKEVLEYKLLGSRRNKPDLEKHELLFTGRAPDQKMDVCISVLYDKRQEGLRLRAVVARLGDNVADIRPLQSGELPDAKDVKTHLAIADEEQRRKAFKTLPLEHFALLQPGWQQRLAASKMFYSKMEDVAAELRMQGWLPDNPSDKLHGQFRKLTAEAAEQWFQADDEDEIYGYGQHFSVVLNTNPGRPDRQELHVNFYSAADTFRLEYRGVVLRQNGVGVGCGCFSDAEQCKARLAGLQQVKAVTDQLHQEGYLTFETKFAAMLSDQVSLAGTPQKNGPYLLTVDLNKYRYQEEAQPFRAHIQVDQGKRSCRLLCIEGEQQAVKIRVFPDHKRWLPDAGVVMDTLTEQIAIRKRQQRAQTIITHQPSSGSQRVRH